MEYHSVFGVILTLVTLITCSNSATSKYRMKRAYTDNFNILLNLYKMNPLKSSNIFKTFSNNMLLPNRAEESNAIMHFDSNESVRENQMRVDRNLKHIEDIIHVEKPHRQEISPPDYIVADTSPEIFSNENRINDIVSDIGHKHVEMKQKKFRSLFADIENDKDGNTIFKTKAIPSLIKSGIKLYVKNQTNINTISDAVHTTSVTLANETYLHKDFDMKFSENGVIIMR
ncbi:uncharacterized protein LOC131845440 [Achroia grisella]|uniref:uncharacterized protein LOC131845440 n=1 Tax=Achroia grisella TaxID=688607 RepID=UPI0027D1F453|nr:uncharacterized protein LOC131845440 [Achroia grisella]